MKQAKLPSALNATITSAVLCGIFSFSIVQASPQRIVSADGALTEIVYALGEEQRLVGVDTTSSYPALATKLPQIGYKRAISAEGVLSLSPDVIIATDDSGPDKVVEQLKAAGVDFRVYSEAPSLDAVEEKIRHIAAMLGKQAEGEQLWAEVKRKVDDAKTQAAKAEQPLRVMFVLSAGERSPLVAGGNTGADTMIRLAGGLNAVEGFDGYKPIPAEALVTARPDVILMMKRAGHTVSADQLFSQPGFSMTPAAENKRLITMNGLKLLGFGPRIGDAISELTTALYGNSEQSAQVVP
ncbi:heme/hemin ABC transporter substrate-binding protein [Neptunomonas antarctica]|uniref:Iron complex transport system substrate-binding protein n=1 Tax=Neptunomonas antarctica TaxID=619304 RepID=A0A1N7LG91_9GAMM|nr:ABC transporter substrate-binding protein [Neptunomonas antarctica]SIS72823.1 iron complex transport system substrate-binding protein [Neptunomonas antarctica]